MTRVSAHARRFRCTWACALALFLAVPSGPRHAAARATLEDLFRPPALRHVIINPSGTYLATIGIRSDGNSVLVRERDHGGIVVALRRKRPIQRLAWMDDERLLVILGGASEPDVYVVSLYLLDGALMTEHSRIAVSGHLIDPLPGAPGEILWATKERSATSVYRVSALALTRAGGKDPRKPGRRERVASMRGHVVRWTADRNGVVRAALRVEEEEPLQVGLWYRASASSEWQRLHLSTEPEEWRIPVGLAENDRDLLVVSNEGRDTWALLEQAVATGRLGREIFSHPDADVTRLVYDYTGRNLIAAVYEEEGLEKFHHFDSFGARYQRSLEHAFPDLVVEITSVSRDQRFFCVLASGPRNPGAYYVLDTEENYAVEVGQLRPWLDSDNLVEVEAFRARSGDGTELEAFLARPTRGGIKPPLVVLPHGGPISVRDTRRFHPLVQYLASAGIAVLQINYRGSSGRGKAFREAGRREWGGRIEDDIDAALDHVVGAGQIDGNRVCIAGASYGGYSSLISVVRHPERFRCAASFAGPTDLPLMLHECNGDKKCLDWYKESVGDPEIEYERLLSISPAYRASEIQVPVFLAHGAEDEVVDVDHFYRMRAMLEALGKRYETLLLEEAGHSPSPDEFMRFALRLRAFLVRNLR